MTELTKEETERIKQHDKQMAKLYMLNDEICKNLINLKQLTKSHQLDDLSE